MADIGRRFFLFAYAVCFSFAYLGLTTGTGHLFVRSVQMTMIAAALAKGDRPGTLELLGVAAALPVWCILSCQGVRSAAFKSLLMAAAGAAWGFYTLRGKQSKDRWRRPREISSGSADDGYCRDTFRWVFAAIGRGVVWRFVGSTGVRRGYSFGTRL